MINQVKIYLEQQNEFGMENTNKGHIYLKNKMAKIMTFNSLKNLIEKLNELELLKETHEKILKKVLKFLKENNIKEQQIKNWSAVK